MKKTAALLLILLLLFCLCACGNKDVKLTMADVRRLAAEKGEELTWSDFARYPSTETGSGLYILVYEIDENYRLMIGGMPNEKPMYIYLVSTTDDEKRIDIRRDDIEAFLNQTN